MNSSRPRLPIARILLLAALLPLASCDNPSPLPSAVNVTVREFNITLDRPIVGEGNVTFHVTNVGEDDHEFLVIRTDRPPDALPTEADGSYEEDGPGTQLLDEIEDIPPGQSRDLQVSLSAGNHVVICNMVHVENGRVEAHYSLGMRTALRVDSRD